MAILSPIKSICLSSSFLEDGEHEETVEPRARPVAQAPIVRIKFRRFDFMVLWFGTV
jgi:hypothetical protein